MNIWRDRLRTVILPVISNAKALSFGSSSGGKMFTGATAIQQEV